MQRLSNPQLSVTLPHDAYRGLCFSADKRDMRGFICIPCTLFINITTPCCHSTVIIRFVLSGGKVSNFFIILFSPPSTCFSIYGSFYLSV
ncbi:hypothetical protein FKM82_028607 [Ascaphus truei]